MVLIEVYPIVQIVIALLSSGLSKSAESIIRNQVVRRILFLKSSETLLYYNSKDRSWNNHCRVSLYIKNI